MNSSHNLHWTLSVYSLENQPVKKNLSIHNSEIFHFMVYDWERTIRELLENSQIPYSIIRFFSPHTIYTDARKEVQRLPDSSGELLTALNSYAESNVTRVFSGAPRDEHADLIFDEKEH